jgi:hypothetical protein
MDWFSFIVQLAESVKWAVALVAVVALLRTPLGQLIPTLYGLRYKDKDRQLELGFRELRQIETVAEEMALSSAPEKLLPQVEVDLRSGAISDEAVTATDSATVSESITILTQASHEDFRTNPEQFVLFTLADLFTVELRFVGSMTLPDGTRITAPDGRRLLSRANALEHIMKQMRPTPGPFTIYMVKKNVEEAEQVAVADLGLDEDSAYRLSQR